MPRTCYCNDLDGCSRCRAYERHPAYAEWAVLPPGRKISCRHRGAGLRRAEHPTPDGKVELKVFACALHNECTAGKMLPGLACCVGCPDYAARPVLQVRSTSAGIGDHMLTLAIAEGLRRQRAGSGVEILLACDAWIRPWVELFGGPDCVPDRLAAPTCVCDNHPVHLWWARGVARWQYWAELFDVTPRLPDAKPLPTAAVEWAVPYAGRVVLAPFAAYSDRTWPLDRWLEVERALLEKGFPCVVLDDRPDRCAAFRSDKLLGEAPARVAAVIQGSLCLAGNDSGMAHVAGMLHARAVAVCSRASDDRIFDLYPTVRALGGRQIGMEAVRPADVLAAVLERVRAGVDPNFPAERFAACLAERDRWRQDVWTPVYSVLWRTVRELNPKRIVEIGVRAGQSAWTMLDACPEASVHGIDAEGADDDLAKGTGGFVGAAAHARSILAGKAFTLQQADSRTLETIPPCDLCYVDGDHGEAGCYADLLLAERSGSTAILVDDYVNCASVRAAVSRFMREHPRRRGWFIASTTGLYLIESVNSV